MKFRLALLPALIAAQTAAQSSAWAEAPATEHLDVVGQAVSMDRAIKEQRNADSIESVVHADGIAQLPDDNAAEALQRIPGVSVERDQGEGRFVRVRGLAPDLNSVTINGTLVPAPEADRRAVALDVLPSELVQSLSVIKTLTPDMDANSLGGTIEVESLSAFDHDGLFYTATVEGSYDDNTGETSPKLSGAVSNRFSVGAGQDNLGVALALSWQDRDFGSDNVETGGAWDFADGARLEEFELRDYQLTRERMGVGLNFDYKADSTTRYYLRTLYSEFTDTETRQSAIIGFDDAIAEGDTTDLEAERELKNREETQEITSIVLGGEKMLGLWTLSAQAGFSEASEDTPDHIASAVFTREDVFADASFRNSREPSPVVAAGFYDAAEYALDEVEIENQIAEDEERNIKVDLLRDYAWGNHPSQLKFGAKISRREKTNDLNIVTYGDFPDAGFTDQQLNLSQFSNGNVDYALGQFGPAISASAVERFLAGADGEVDEEGSRLEDYRIREDINAAYIMNSVDIADWRVMVGLRYEGTEQESKGTGFENDEFVELNSDNDYDNWLPGLHLRYRMGEDTQLRFAWTNVVVRPTFDQIRPGVYDADDEYEAGNPNLDPLESSNLDLGIEHYLGRAGVVSAFIFYKDIENFIYETDLAGSPAFADYDEAITYANGDSASLYGIELAYSQKLEQLPAPFNGVIVGANLTFTESDADISGYADGEYHNRSIELPNQSDTVGNLMLGWENESLSMRLSANYKSEYLDEVSGFGSDQNDVFAESQTIVDFSASYFVTTQLQVKFEALNITDEPYYTYVNRNRYNAQYEEYGPTYKLGLTFTQF